MKITSDSPTDYRALWTFMMRAGDLIAPAYAKQSIAKARYDHWVREYDDAKKDKAAVEADEEERFEGREEVFAFASYQQVDYAGTRSGMANTPQQRLDNAKFHRNKHLSAAEEYGRYIRAFEANPDKMLLLTVSDLEFFGG